ncbi:MAG: class II aldolase/adducin family protein, partial [Pseudomonadota bacterium]
WDGPLKPSTEWRFHWLTMTRRHDVTALIHAHPPYATALSILREPIPPCHYMIAAFGGMDVRVCDYATVGSSELAEYVLAGLDGRNACLMANHGIVATGLGLEQALWRTGELEAVARHYHLARQIGEPVLLKEEEIADTHRVFAGYGLRGTEDTRDPTGRGLI